MMKKRIMAALLLMTAVSITAAEAVPQPENDDSITIYFVRHGKTLLNTSDRVQGWVDSPLTPQGVTMAREVGEGMKNIKFDRFYSSDAGRQRETMQVLLQQAGVKNYQLRELKGLREVFFGGFEGRPNPEMAAAIAKHMGLKDSAALIGGMKNGEITIQQQIDSMAAADSTHQAETYPQVKARTASALTTMIDEAKAHKEKTLLAISSGMAIQAMIANLTDNPAKNKPLSNAAVVKIIYRNGTFSVPEIGNMQYLAEGKAALEKQPESATSPSS